jgi:tRNA (guanosine-2'-O-)-methyltransferase
MTSERQARVDAVLDNRQNNITLILENVSDPHNVSAVMRTADSMGISEIYVLNTVLSTHKRWGLQSSSSAAKWIQAHQFDNFEQCIAAVKKKYNKIYTTHLAVGAKSIYETDFTESVALVFGNEASGLTKEMLAISDGNILIPQVGMIKSLNISVACAVTIYEAYRQKLLAGHYAHRSLSETETNQLMEFWDREDWKMRLPKKER